MLERFDFEEESVVRRGPRLNILDVLTGLVLMLTVALAAVMAYVFIKPDTPINPLKPKIPTPFAFPTATITPLQMEATLPKGARRSGYQSGLGDHPIKNPASISGNHRYIQPDRYIDSIEYRYQI